MNKIPLNPPASEPD